MNRLTFLTHLLDRHCDRLLMAASGLMTAFFISFLIIAFNATTALAQANNAQTCGGKDLIAHFEETDPDKLAGLEAQAAKTINGDAIFWKVSKAGLEDSYVLGTMHMADERIARLDGARRKAFEKSETVIIENVEALDPAQASAALLQHKELTLYTDGTTLSEKLDAETFAKLKTATQERGMPIAMVQIMKPWLVATSVALPACELVAKGAGNPVLDGLIANEARETGKALIGLESIGEQFSAMASLPETFHLKALRETLNMGDLALDVMETMKLLYLEGRIAMIMPLTKAVSPKTSQSEDYKGFQDSLITRRNAVMAERSLPYLEKGASFIAVGALHLPGESGLINAFREAGYSVTAVQ